MPGINGDMPYLTEHTLHCFALFYYYFQTYIAPLYIFYIYIYNNISCSHVFVVNVHVTEIVYL